MSAKRCRRLTGRPLAFDVFHDPHMLGHIREFYGENSYFYLCFTKGISEEWGASVCTGRHLVAESRNRISQIERFPPKSVESNHMLTLCMRAAALKGNVDGVARIRRYCERRHIRLSSPRSVPVMDAAARSGSIETLEYLFRHHNLVGTPTMMEAVHSDNSVEVVRWLMDHKGEWEFNDDVEVEAAKIGNIGALEVFSQREKFPGFAEKVLKYAGVSGSIDLVNYLVGAERGLKPPVLCMAAMKGHLHLVMHLRETLRCRWNATVCWMAAYFGHLHVLQWLRGQNPPCPWDSMVLRVAKQRNHSEVLKFAVENDCPGSARYR